MNEQLRNAANEVVAVTERIQLPVPARPGGFGGRRWATMVAVGIIAVVLVWVNMGSPSTEMAAADESLVASWLEGAVDGRFDEIAGLTHTEQASPDALNLLAATLHEYGVDHGEPVVRVWFMTASRSGLGMVCIDVDFGAVSVKTGMVVRDWPGIGRKLWEVRPMEGCVSDARTTTTVN